MTIRYQSLDLAVYDRETGYTYHAETPMQAAYLASQLNKVPPPQECSCKYHDGLVYSKCDFCKGADK